MTAYQISIVNRSPGLVLISFWVYYWRLSAQLLCRLVSGMMQRPGPYMSKSLWRKCQDNEGAEEIGLHASLVCWPGVWGLFSQLTLFRVSQWKNLNYCQEGPCTLSLLGVVILCPGELLYQFRVPLYSAYTLVNMGITRRCCRFSSDHLNKANNNKAGHTVFVCLFPSV